MNEQEPPGQLGELEARIASLKAKVAGGNKAGKAHEPASGYGLAFMVAADMVGGLIGGGLLGWGIDSWLDTAPFGLIAFFLLGAMAGMWNVYRTIRGQTSASGLQRPPPKLTEPGRDAQGLSILSGKSEKEG
ncbi:MAG: AtpZ/AtpI family protein [Rhodospirillales bacterium]|nr:AtpZ/AtpI family protein [Rhodospirillales bacterium]